MSADPSDLAAERIVLHQVYCPVPGCPESAVSADEWDAAQAVADHLNDEHAPEEVPDSP